MTKIIKIKNRARKEKEKQIKEMNAFSKRYLSGTKDILTMVLKGHLYIEFYIDEIFKLILVKPKKILEKKFSTKIDFFESLGLQLKPQIFEEIRALNIIRNKFAHNLNYRITAKDLQPLIKGINSIKSKTNIKKLKYGLYDIVSYLHIIKLCYKFFPFSTTCFLCSDIFKREKNYKLKKIYKIVNPNDEMRDVLNDLKKNIKKCHFKIY